jgi:2-polyprenyl-6-methoxyphenol hydroxylase-like FAD-dependent oxidoreductase
MLGIADTIRARKPPAPSGGIYTWRGQPLVTESSAALERRVGEISVVVHRAELLAILYQALGSETVRLNSPCIAVAQDADSVTARFVDGSEAHGDLLIGADGIRSVVRAQIIGDGEPIYAGYTSYRGVAAFDPARIIPGEYWGRGARFGMAPMSGGRVYWWATRNAPSGEHQAPLEEYARLLEQFHGWADPIKEVLQATDPQTILHHDIADRPPLTHWSVGRISLLGDAAHPMTPNLGQGACQALEDAAVLADCLRRQGDIMTALHTYEQRRRPRANQIVRQSRRIGQIGQWSQPLACRLRDLVLRTIVAPRQAQGVDQVVGYRV